MTKTKLSALGSRKKTCVSIILALLILLPVVVQACAQWVFPWPDSSNLPAGATQYGNVFPGGNLWGGGTLYTPAHPPQRYLTWTCEYSDKGLPSIHGALDPGMATYRVSNEAFILGLDRYNFDGMGVTEPWPTGPGCTPWLPCIEEGRACEAFGEGIPGNPGVSVQVGPHRMSLFYISNPGNNRPNTETHAWISFDYVDVEDEDETVPPFTLVLGPGAVTDGWYLEPADVATEKWGRLGFAVTFGPNFEDQILGIANWAPRDVFVDNVQIAAVTVPEPGTWGLVALGGLVLIVSRRLRCRARRT